MSVDDDAVEPGALVRFVVSPERRDDARRARRAVYTVAAVLAVLAVAGLVVFPPGSGTRLTLTGGAIVLLVLAVLLAVRVLRVASKADRLVAVDGSMLTIAATEVTVAGDTRIPWAAVSGVWAVDRAVELRRRAGRGLFGLPGRLMLRAGVDTADITIGIADTTVIQDPAARVRRFRALPSGLVPGRIEVPLGAQFGTGDLSQALAAFRRALPDDVPVRLASGDFDYAAAWAATADDVATIRANEASRTD